MWQNYAKISWDLNRYSDAAAALIRADILQPDSTLYFQAAVATIHAKQGDKALNMFETLMARAKGKSVNSWIETYISLCQQQGALTRGLTSLKQWQPWFEDRSEFWYLLAILHVHAHQFQQATASLQVLESIQPLDKQRKELLANLLLQVNVPLHAARLYQQLVDDYPSNHRYIGQLITSYRLGLQPEKALQVVNQAITASPSVKWLQLKGELCFELQQFDEAITAFNQVLKIEPQTGSAYLYQGYCALQMDKRELAHTVLIHALQFKKQKKEAKRLLAWLQKT